jgi:hypothetical protein
LFEHGIFQKPDPSFGPVLLYVELALNLIFLALQNRGAAPVLPRTIMRIGSSVWRR